MTNLSAAREEFRNPLPPEWELEPENREHEVPIDICLLRQVIDQALEKWEKKKSKAVAAPPNDSGKLNGFPPHQPFAVFYGNSVNLGPIGHSGKNTPPASGLEEISRLISHYEKLLAEKERKLLDLEIALDTQKLMNDEWDEPI